MLELDTCIWGCEVPIGLGVFGIAIVLPGFDFVDEGLFVGDAAVEALRGKDAEFGLCQIEPAAVFWRVVPFEALDQSAGFGSRERFIKGSLAVDVEIVLDQNDGLGGGEVKVGQVFQDVSIIHGGVAIGDFDVAPTFERGKHHKEIGGSVALVLVIMTGWACRFHRNRYVCLGEELF